MTNSKIINSLFSNLEKTIADAGMTVQTLIFSKDKYKSVQDVKDWARKNNFEAGKVDETGDSYRIRQRDPGDFEEGSFRTITFKPGIKAVVGKPKSK